MALRFSAPWTALSFLTRLAPPPSDVDEKLLVASVAWYPFVGLIVGLGSVLLPFLGLGSSHWLLQGLLYVLSGVWITRGLHWDGVADVADAWGSAQRGERFHAILKDSRIGAFGAMALVLGLCGQIVLAGLLFQTFNGAALVLAPVAGRMAGVMLAGMSPAHPDSTLGRFVVKASTKRLVWIHGLSLALFTGIYFGFQPVVCLTGSLLIILYGLRRLVLREGGVNGDFMGCAIVCSELAVMSCCL